MKYRKLLNSELDRLDAASYSGADCSGMVVILDNVRSANNVGSAFRTADCFHCDSLCLCGICAEPPSAQIHKTALGAEMVVPFKHYDDTLQAVRELRGKGYKIVGVEQAENSVSLENFTMSPSSGYAFVFGNEVDGVSQQVLEACDIVLEIPQWGTKHSLNVAVSVGIVLWQCVAGIAVMNLNVTR